MYFLKAIVLGFATLAAAQSSSLKFTDAPMSVEVGKTYDLTYTAADLSSPVTITLKNGPGTNLQTVETLGTATGGSYSWTVSSYPDGDYALEISQGSETNYWGPFPLSGGSAATSGAASSAAVSSAPAYSSVVVASASGSAYSSLTYSNNATTVYTSHGTAASGTGHMTYHRNTTLSSATLKTTKKTTHKTATITKATHKETTTAASSTSSHPGASSVPTGAASSLEISSPFALFFGVMGALAYLN